MSPSIAKTMEKRVGESRTLSREITRSLSREITKGLRKELTAQILLVAGAIATIASAVADADIFMYLCATAGLSGARMLDKKGGQL